MRIDAHQHFWKYHAQQQQWIDHHMSAIKRDFLPVSLYKPMKRGRKQIFSWIWLDSIPL